MKHFFGIMSGLMMVASGATIAIMHDYKFAAYCMGCAIVSALYEIQATIEEK